MKHTLEFEIQSQPTDTSCGPTCLAAVYDYWNVPVDLSQLIIDIGQLDSGGTLAVHLACNALRRGFAAEINTYNLQLFDPSWFDKNGEMKSAALVSDKLRVQWEAKRDRTDLDQHRLQTATQCYREFLSLEGRLRMLPLDAALIAQTLLQGTPILCGLSATYLYLESRERPQTSADLGMSSGTAMAPGMRMVADDVAGDPTGHFVILHGYEPETSTVLIADPLHPNPLAPTNKYAAPLSRVTSAILLGILTYDANLLTIVPR